MVNESAKGRIYPPKESGLVMKKAKDLFVKAAPQVP
jgi:hypothetical protein